MQVFSSTPPFFFGQKWTHINMCLSKYSLDKPIKNKAILLDSMKHNQRPNKIKYYAVFMHLSIPSASAFKFNTGIWTQKYPLAWKFLDDRAEMGLAFTKMKISLMMNPCCWKNWRNIFSNCGHIFSFQYTTISNTVS